MLNFNSYGFIVNVDLIITRDRNFLCVVFVFYDFFTTFCVRMIFRQNPGICRQVSDKKGELKEVN